MKISTWLVIGGALALYLLWPKGPASITLPNGQVLTPLLNKTLGNSQVTDAYGNLAYTNPSGQAVTANGALITNWGIQPG
jgi:hypothetical protein